MAADFAELVAIIQAIGEELYKRTTKRLEGRPQLKLVIAVLGVSVCLLIAGRTAVWIFSTPTGTSLGRVSGTVFSMVSPYQVRPLNSRHIRGQPPTV